MLDIDGRACVLIGDRRPLHGAGIVSALAALSTAVVTGCATTTSALEQHLIDHDADVVVLDDELYPTPLLAVRALKAHTADPAILLLYTKIDTSLLSALTYAGTSCLSAFSSSAAVLQSVSALLAGETNLPPDIQQALLARSFPQTQPSKGLTSREREVFALAAKGKTAAGIAVALHVSESTIKTHLRRAYEKLGASNRSAAIATAITTGTLTSADLNRDIAAAPQNVLYAPIAA